MRAAAALLLILATALPASAAQVTEVKNSFDSSQPLDLDLEATYVHSKADTRITQETPQSGGIGLVDALSHSRTVDEIDFALRVGIWRNLDLRFLVPYVLRDEQDWSYAGNPATNPLATNTIGVSGCAGSTTTCTTVQPTITPGHSARKGLRDPTIGIAWAAVNPARDLPGRPDVFPDPKRAKWVLGLDYTLPLPIDVDSPAMFGALAVPGNGISGHEAKKAHVFTAWTAFSKRYRVADPYLRISGTYAFAPHGNGSFDNCSNQAVLADVAPANCAAPDWKGDTGYKPPIQGALTIGSEFVLSEDPAEDRKMVFDLRGTLTYVGAARTYTQIADALGKLTYSDEYANAALAGGFSGRLASWIRFRVEGTASYDTPHFLTTEAIGKDINGNGVVEISPGPGLPAPEQNPTYDFRIDQPGHRLRAERTILWGASGTLTITF